MMLVGACVATAQQRQVDRYDLSSAEGALIGFYSAALFFAPLGQSISGGAPAGSMELGFELSLLPHLSREQRTAGFDKPESSNLSPLLPRPRFSFVPTEFLVVELSWVPPLPVKDAKANLMSASASWQLSSGSISLTPRISFLTGRVTGAITCNKQLDSGTPADQLYFADVCHGNESEDHFEPSVVAADIVAGTSSLFGSHLYVGAGVSRERSKFDIGVIKDNGERDSDHPILELSATRAYGMAGAQFRRGRFRYVAEMFVAPGSLVTARALAGFTLR